MESLELEIYRGYAAMIPSPSKRTPSPQQISLDKLCESFSAFFFDGFGTLYNLSERHPGTEQALAHLRSQVKILRLVTNAASRPVEILHKHLLSMGVHFEPHEIISSGDLLTEENGNLGIGSAFHLGHSDALGFLRSAGIAPMEEPEEATVILTSVSPKEQHRIEQASRILRKPGARLVVLNPDAWAPKLDGTRIPVSGAAAWKLQQETGCKMHLLGKPFPAIFNKTIRSSGIPSEKCIMIGDTLGTDILGAQRAGITAALLLGGNTSASQREVDQNDLEVYPDFYLERLWG